MHSSSQVLLPCHPHWAGNRSMPRKVEKTRISASSFWGRRLGCKFQCSPSLAGWSWNLYHHLLKMEGEKECARVDGRTEERKGKRERRKEEEEERREEEWTGYSLKYSSKREIQKFWNSQILYPLFIVLSIVSYVLPVFPSAYCTWPWSYSLGRPGKSRLVSKMSTITNSSNSQAPTNWRWARFESQGNKCISILMKIKFDGIRE